MGFSLQIFWVMAIYFNLYLGGDGNYFETIDFGRKAIRIVSVCYRRTIKRPWIPTGNSLLRFEEPHGPSLEKLLFFLGNHIRSIGFCSISIAFFEYLLIWLGNPSIWLEFQKEIYWLGQGNPHWIGNGEPIDFGWEIHWFALGIHWLDSGDLHWIG